MNDCEKFIVDFGETCPVAAARSYKPIDPLSTDIDYRMYFNSQYVMNNEIEAILKSVTQKEYDMFLGIPIYVVWARFDPVDSKLCQIIFVSGTNIYYVYSTTDFENPQLIFSVNSGWYDQFRIYAQEFAISHINLNRGYNNPISSWNGIPIGQENDKLSKIISCEPFSG